MPSGRSCGLSSSGSRDPKRRWGDGVDITVRPGEYTGVRNRGFVVEIKKWYEGVDFYKDVKMTEGVAALVHDLARLYVDRDCGHLNIQKLESRMQREDPDLAISSGNPPVEIGKDFLVAFVENNPLAPAGDNAKERADAMKDKIIALAPVVYARLEEKITRELSSRAGRHKKGVQEIPRDLVVQLNKEIQDLKAQNTVRDAEITFLRELNVARGAEITSLKAACDAAEHKGRAAVVDELCAVNRAPSMTPFKSGVAVRENFLQQSESNSDSESWMSFVDWTKTRDYYHN